MKRRQKRSERTTTTKKKGAVFQGVYEFAKHRCYYERKGDLRKAKVHVIFLHGFGVGTFHYRKQLNALSDEEVCAWSMDICGQGKSWPRSGEDVRDFEYSMDSWRDQVEYFVREVVFEIIDGGGEGEGGARGELFGREVGAVRRRDERRYHRWDYFVKRDAVLGISGEESALFDERERVHREIDATVLG